MVKNYDYIVKKVYLNIISSITNLNFELNFYFNNSSIYE